MSNFSTCDQASIGVTGIESVRSYLMSSPGKEKVFLLLLCIAGIGVIWAVSHMSVSFELDWESQDNLWFMQRFQKDITPFLTRDYTLSQEAFNWWKKVQLERRNKIFFKMTTEKIFKIIPAHPPVAEPSPFSIRTCAVVGNSANLLRSHYGKLIDHQTFVFRINFGKTEGFEEDVGNRTTHRVMYPESASRLDNSTHLVLFPFKILDLEWLVGALTTGINATSYAPIIGRISANKNLVMVINPAFMKYVHESWLQKHGDYPSTGFMTVILALHICDKVSVFGFGADSKGSWSHYWEVLKNMKFRTGPHAGSAEYSMVLELAKHRKITFYTGR